MRTVNIFIPTSYVWIPRKQFCCDNLFCSFIFNLLLRKVSNKRIKDFCYFWTAEWMGSQSNPWHSLIYSKGPACLFIYLNLWSLVWATRTHTEKSCLTCYFPNAILTMCSKFLKLIFPQHEVQYCSANRYPTPLSLSFVRNSEKRKSLN